MLAYIDKEGTLLVLKDRLNNKINEHDNSSAHSLTL